MKSPSSPLSSTQRKRDSISSVGSGASSLKSSALLTPQLHSNSQPMMNYMNTHGAALFSNQPPYLKEGVVVRKHLLENATQRARHREWKDCFLIVSEGELKMYSLQGNPHYTPSSGYNKVSSFTEGDRRSLLRSSSIGVSSMYDVKSQNDSSNDNSRWGVCNHIYIYMNKVSFLYYLFIYYHPYIN